MVIGVLALQGAVSEHVALLKRCNVQTKLIKEPADLQGIKGIVLPGGESTTMHKLLVRERLLAPLKNLVQHNFPVFGTCAGLVLLTQPETFNSFDGEVIRNGFGRQRESFESAIEVAGFTDPFPGVFIRAPYLKKVGTDVKVLATLAANRIVAARQKNILVTAFHPELTLDTRFHELFVNQVVPMSKFVAN
ncbi:pyridoxal 5'-phosphate synthase glutaminase subunit PdxT [Liquorilactobacillus satsumensis]|uniref:Pyridoxal 5'-phosphate synthase subunit PdxT n=1 Tax=Liquorilactobacillus satsumensis DSM 16230 = JCM 12392 TaxID=1423801 RepID=A0A0R1UZY9_9LACO|nr:pyridoxal 5'-phosphate synthase glutaminase subunit PdxT [Liquorilactobacillus satsumensis]KRL98921.1 glutamine amidotransferase subunit PdxT [Liquorilactobacillus satsumensis DSM 16230 = JCM 12392]